MLPKYLSAYRIDIPTQHVSVTKVTQNETRQGKNFTAPSVVGPLILYLRVATEQGTAWPKN